MSQSRSLSYVLQPRAVGQGGGGSRPAPAGSRRRRSRSRWSRESVRPARAAAPGPVRAGSLRGPARGVLRPAPRPRRGAAAADGGAALAHAAQGRRAAGADLLALHADLGRPTSSSRRRRSSPASGSRTSSGPRPRPRASPPRWRARATGASRSCKKLLFPTKAGTLTIPASVFRVGLARTGFFDAGGSVERTTKPVTVSVEPLPDGPASAAPSAASARRRASTGTPSRSARRRPCASASRAPAT